MPEQRLTIGCIFILAGTLVSCGGSAEPGAAGANGAKGGNGAAAGFVSVPASSAGTSSGTGGSGSAGAAPGGTTGSATATGSGGCGGPHYCPPVCQSWVPPHEADGGAAPMGPDGGALTNGKPGCVAVSCGTRAPQPTSADDRTLGFTAADLLDAVVGPGIADLTWYDGTSTTLRLSARYVNLSVEVARPDAPDAGTIPFAECGELDADQAIVTLSTDDGRLAGEEIPAQFVGGTEPNQPPIVFPLFSPFGDGIDLAAAHGSLTLPDDWGAVAGSAHVGLAGIVPKSSSCSPYCLPNPTAADTAWSVNGSCGYDGKIVAKFGVSAPPPGCSEAITTLATWRWR